MSATTVELARLIDRIAPNSTVLDLRGYGLEALPENIGDLTYLTKLNLNGNRLTSLPESIGNLTNLTELYLNGHKLTNLPESIGNLTNLTRLDLNGDRLESLPDSIANLTKLTELNLNGNRFDRIPDVLFGLPNLEKINLDGNPLTDLSNITNISNIKIHHSHAISKFKLVTLKNSISKFKFITLKNITNISIGDIYLDRVVADLTSYINIVSLSMNGYGVSISKNRDPSQSISPAAIEKILLDLIKLPKLSFFNWHIDLFPYFSIIESIPSLDLVSFLGIFIFHHELQSIPCLLHLNIQENRWTDLSVLQKLPKLEIIYLCCNKSIGDTGNIDHITSLNNLKHLYIYGGKLKSLPNSIEHLSQLQTLRLDNNQLDSLPESISSLNNLRTLYLNNNPILDLSILTKIKSLEKVAFGSIYLPRRYWTKLSEWKPEWLLDENNTEIRRMLTEKIGYEKICKVLNAVELDNWREYILLKIEEFEPVFERSWQPSRREEIVLLKKTCLSTGQVNIVKVPSHITNAEEAVDWLSYGIYLDKFAVYI